MHEIRVHLEKFSLNVHVFYASSYVYLTKFVHTKVFLYMVASYVCIITHVQCILSSWAGVQMIKHLVTNFCFFYVVQWIGTGHHEIT